MGVDENGLGPRLGPMIVTAVLAEVTPEGHKTASRKLRGKLAERLGDSKALVAHGDVALGEAWTRALVAKGCGRAGATARPATVHELVDAVSADERAWLRALCKGQAEAQCWGAGEAALSAPAELVDTLCADVDKLAEKGISLKAVRSKIVCTRRLNDALLQKKSRFAVDLHAMEELFLSLREAAGAEVYAVCGKVGGLGNYEAAFGPLSGRLHSVVEERRAASRYYFPGLGEIGFVMDADDSDVLVGLSSLVGKYVREALMGNIVAHYRAADPSLPDASGYHDPVTAAFVEATTLIRTQQGIEDGCFERRRAGGT